MFQEGIGRVRALVVGAGDHARKIVERLHRHPEGKYDILGLLDDTHQTGETVFGRPVLGPVEQLPDWANTLAADEVFFVDSKMERREMLNLVVSCGEKSTIRQYNILTDMMGVVADDALFR